MKLCKDCRHVRPSHFMGEIDQYARCDLFRQTPNMVTGVEVLTICEIARNDLCMCGPEAKRFEERTK